MSSTNTSSTSSGEDGQAAVKATVREAARVNEVAYRQYEEFAELSRGNLDAFLKSSTVMVRGAQEVAREMIAMVQGGMEDAVRSARSFSSCRDWQQFAQMQTEITRQRLEKTLQQTERLSRTSVRTMEQAAAPIRERLDQARGMVDRYEAALPR